MDSPLEGDGFEPSVPVAREPVYIAEGELRADRRAAKKNLAGYRWFESISLQRRVQCEPGVSATGSKCGLVLPDVSVGMIEASATRRPAMPWTRSWASTTANGSARRSSCVQDGETAPTEQRNHFRLEQGGFAEPFLGFLSREIVDRAVLSLKDAGVPSFLIE